MGQHRSATIALECAAEAWAENNRAGQRHKSADRVHDCGPGEIMERHSGRGPEMSIRAHHGEPAIRTPGPVTDDRVNESGNGHAVKQVASESGAADHRSRGDSGAGIGESELEYPDRQERDACGFVRGWRALQEEPVIADEAVAVAEHEGKADRVEENAAETSVNHAFH